VAAIGKGETNAGKYCGAGGVVRSCRDFVCLKGLGGPNELVSAGHGDRGTVDVFKGADVLVVGIDVANQGTCPG